MLTPKEAAYRWEQVVSIYKKDESNRPDITAEKIVMAMGLDDAIETFAVIAAHKKHDGRIYGRNREFMDSIPYEPSCVERVSSNPVIYAGLDEIHTAHIDQIIGELYKLRKENA